MEIILTKDVNDLGLAGQVLKVANGYARNYLLPQGAALEATANNLRLLSKRRAEFENRAKEAKDLAQAFKDELSGLTLTIAAKAGENSRLFGAVTAQDIVNAAEAKGVILDRKKIRLSEPIKSLGDYEINIKIHAEVSAAFKIKVVAEGAELALSDEASAASLPAQSENEASVPAAKDSPSEA
ncbi:MAG: 50S ribosomal protein L9 [Deltaproteobacteria bacterium]|jgi:large subunit ribosomal protein L9|nr:50S ribosomal protein L9 [Deltaproteobacteria bacterium]